MLYKVQMRYVTHSVEVVNSRVFEKGLSNLHWQWDVLVKKKKREKQQLEKDKQLAGSISFCFHAVISLRASGS